MKMLFLLLGLSLITVQNPRSTADSVDDIVGKWMFVTPGWKAAMDIKADGSYTVDLGNDGQLDVKGNYSVADGVVTFIDSSGDMSCPGVEGKYKFSVAEGVMTAELISDECKGRKEAMAVKGKKM